MDGFLKSWLNIVALLDLFTAWMTWTLANVGCLHRPTGKVTLSSVVLRALHKKSLMGLLKGMIQTPCMGLEILKTLMGPWSSDDKFTLGIHTPHLPSPQWKIKLILHFLGLPRKRIPTDGAPTWSWPLFLSNKSGNSSCCSYSQVKNRVQGFLKPCKNKPFFVSVRICSRPPNNRPYTIYVDCIVHNVFMLYPKVRLVINWPSIGIIILIILVIFRQGSPVHYPLVSQVTNFNTLPANNCPNGGRLQASSPSPASHNTLPARVNTGSPGWQRPLTPFVTFYWTKKFLVFKVPHRTEVEDLSPDPPVATSNLSTTERWIPWLKSEKTPRGHLSLKATESTHNSLRTPPWSCTRTTMYLTCQPNWDTQTTRTLDRSRQTSIEKLPKSSRLWHQVAKISLVLNPRVGCPPCSGVFLSSQTKPILMTRVLHF